MDGSSVRPWIFLSYARSTGGGGWAARQIATGVERYSGPNSVFCDVRSIEPGVLWEQEIVESLAACRAFIVLIDPFWSLQRLSDPGNWVRREIEFAIEHRLLIVPVVLDGADMPAADALPDSLAPLAGVQALFVDGRSDLVFEASLRVLAQHIFDSIHTKMVLTRERQGWWEELQDNFWLLYIDSDPLLALTDTATSASAIIKTGPHKLKVKWLEKERDSHYGRAYGPGRSSSGEADLEVVLKPGEYTLTLERAPGTEGVLRRILNVLTSADDAPRRIQLTYRGDTPAVAHP